MPYRLIAVSPSAWMLTGLWMWFPVALFVFCWTGFQARLGWHWAILEALGLWGASALTRVIGAVCYNSVVAPRAPFIAWLKSRRVERLGFWRNVWTIWSFALPFSVIQGSLANLFGWTVILVGRWWLVPLLLFIMANVYALGGVMLYNQVVVPWYGPIALRRVDGHEQALTIITLDQRSVGWSAAIWTLCWAVLGVGLVGLVGGLLLTILAGHIPAGAFGVEIGLFAVVLAVFLGYWVALGAGVWMQWGAAIAERWVPKVPWLGLGARAEVDA
jgi:hypothetical protein